MSTHVLSMKQNIGGILPAGIVCPYVGSVAPTGFLICNGAAFSQSTYPNLYAVLGNSTTLPDLRGYFIRGLDSGAGRDSGRTLRSIQDDSTALPNTSFTTNSTGAQKIGMNYQHLQLVLQRLGLTLIV
jgi:microcystin-dependent protein